MALRKAYIQYCNAYISVYLYLCFVLTVEMNNVQHLYPFIYIHNMGTSVLIWLSKDLYALTDTWAVRVFCSSIYMEMKGPG